MAASGSVFSLRLVLFIVFTISLVFINAERTENGKANTGSPKKQHSDGQDKSLKDKYHGERDRQHIIETLELDQTIAASVRQGRKSRVEQALAKLTEIYETVIRPVEELYNFKSLDGYVVTNAEIVAKPMVLLVGPWSTGKSTMVNYLVGIDEQKHKLHTGAEPTTSDFTVIMQGDKFKHMEGLVLAADSSKSFRTLETFGKGFLEKFQGVEMPKKLLEHVTFVDTPGIIENRKQQERGYPFNDVMRWFIERSDLIFVVFDPTKLDVGTELETLFKQLKGRESQIRIILNKADTINTQELMRVYGALFWSLAPLINVTEPPRVYTGSFWSNNYLQSTHTPLFQKEEISLLQDMHDIMDNRMENKISFIRHHAIKVKIHALLVDRYLKTFSERKSIFGDADGLWTDIIENPKKYNIFQTVLAEGRISKYDMPDPVHYREFFAINAINSFRPISSHCSYFNGCPLDPLELVISEDLPNLMRDFRNSDVCSQSGCNEP